MTHLPTSASPSVLCLLMISFGVVVAGRGDAQTMNADRDDYRQLLAQLDAAEYEQREAATRALMADAALTRQRWRELWDAAISAGGTPERVHRLGAVGESDSRLEAERTTSADDDRAGGVRDRDRVRAAIGNHPSAISTSPRVGCALPLQWPARGLAGRALSPAFREPCHGDDAP